MIQEDFLLEMGHDGLTARLKRLSDLFIYQTKEFYKSKKLDIEPNWHMVFLLLQKHNKLTVTEMAETLRISHPAMIKLINKMKKSGYISSQQDKSDLRKFYLSLSKKAVRELPKLEMHWKALSQALKEMMDNDETILKLLGNMENKFIEMDYMSRAEEKMNK
ncbi:MarR family winged helix-turn-helix transcriptional regulator [Echinicola sp. 20G]|uniref:MarR family winged helix-turn-helix transcriptional regulator n=1 Tax=Echinicola sp. 20G TaxID=2781961 RepID=UPI001F25F13F|nr:MarR family transcriptional regulator [Echinicola sp. 20G]